MLVLLLRWHPRALATAATISAKVAAAVPAPCAEAAAATAAANRAPHPAYPLALAACAAASGLMGRPSGEQLRWGVRTDVCLADHVVRGCV